jgi:TonB-dependent SusC/RagA subfamily outer membrane receptor
MSSRSRSRLPFLLGVIAATAASPLSAQETGEITGRITNAATLRPIDGVQISVQGTGIGTLTDVDGRFVLMSVPVGQVTISFDNIGFAHESREVTVHAGTTTQLDVTLSERAIALDELVVTGSAAAAQKRTIGNSIASVNAGDIVEKMPVVSVDQLINGRMAGVSMNLSGGGGAFGGQIRIRGMKSVSIAGDPVIYVDGIRVDGGFDDNSAVYIGGQKLSRILDLQAADIERVEVVRGAAAASLYGTQGSNGVIQIFTRRGRVGAPQWLFEMEHGLERVPTDTFPGRLFNRFVGPNGFRARDPVETVENGYHSRYLASVNGGSEAVKYYISGSYRGQEGSIAPTTNWLKQFNGRANLSTTIRENVTVTATTSLTDTRLRVPDNDNALHGTYSQFASAVPYTATEDRPYGERFGSFTANQTVENLQRVIRNTTGISVEHQIAQGVRQHIRAGLDWYSDEFTKYFPFAYQGSGNKLGNKTNQTRTFRDITAEYRLQLDNSFSDAFVSTFVVGGQGDFRHTSRVVAFGTDFPAPGVRSISSTATTNASESQIEEVNAGLFIQETIGLWDKLFLTGALRVDGNSAFGNDFQTQAYPKFSAAYNISDEGFWPASIVPTLKLRFAYGESGLAPSQFAADRTYTPISAQDGQPAVTPGNIGNTNLGPERSQEFELGLDAGLWNDRIGIELTGYLQRTRDALLQVPYPPSQGFLQTQLTNIGEIENRGIELAVDGILLQRSGIEWSAGVNYARASNEVTDLGGIPPFNISGARIAEGYPVMGQWGYESVGWDPVTRQVIRSDTMVFMGQADPEWFGSISSTVRFGAFQLSGMLEYTGGQVRTNFDRYWSTRVRTGDDYLSLLEDEQGTPTPAADSLYNYAQTLGSGAYNEPAGYTSLRELSLAVNLPDEWVGRFGFRNSSIRLSGRNLLLWSEYGGISPETKRREGVLANNTSFDTQPTPRVFLLTFRTSR